jgi:hypothetical protein
MLFLLLLLLLLLLDMTDITEEFSDQCMTSACEPNG